MADDVTALPPTIAQLPFFASGRFPRPDLLGRCENGSVVHISGRELIERVVADGFEHAEPGLALARLLREGAQ